jgi:hypothetical protein
MKLKLDNGEILECDSVYCTTVSCIPKYILNTCPIRLTRNYINACTWALSMGHSHIRTVSYLINDRRYHKYVPTCNMLYSTSTERWIRTHLLYDEI